MKAEEVHINSRVIELRSEILQRTTRFLLKQEPGSEMPYLTKSN